MSDPSAYRVVYVEPGKPAVEKKIGTKLEDLQAEVGGLIECIYAHRDGNGITPRGAHDSDVMGAHFYLRKL